MKRLKSSFWSLYFPADSQELNLKKHSQLLMCFRLSQAAGTVVPRPGAEVLCSAQPLPRDQTTLSSAKGGVEGLLEYAGPPRAGMTCAAGGSISHLSCTDQPQRPKPKAKTPQPVILKLIWGKQHKSTIPALTGLPHTVWPCPATGDLTAV